MSNSTPELPPPQPSSSARVAAVATSNGQDTMMRVQAELHQGALDAPHVLRAYHEISPELLNRVVTLAEKQADHRRATEQRVVISQIRRSWGGMVSGLVIALAGMGLAGYMVMQDNPWASVIFGSVDLLALVTTFVRGQSKEPK
jgi:uncharacterized membrane protein